MQTTLVKEINDYYNDIKKEILEELEQANNSESFDPLLYKKNKNFLETRIESYQQEAIHEIKRRVKSLCFDKTSKSGLYELRLKILEII